MSNEHPPPKQRREKLASLLTKIQQTESVALKFELVGQLGKIRSRVRTKSGRREYFLDFRPYGYVRSNKGSPISDEYGAQRLLERIRAEVADDTPLEDVLARYLPEDSKPNLITTWLANSIEVKQRETDAGDRSPTYLRELNRFTRTDGHFSWWSDRSIHDIDYGALEDWSHWLADRGLSPRTRYNVIAAFRSFLSWLKRRKKIKEIPEFPWPKVREYEPRVLAIETQDAILAAIPERDRGIFLAMGRMGLRPSEAMALEAADFRDGWLHVSKAVKGSRLSDPVRAPKKQSA